MAKGRPAGLRLETAERGQIEFQQGSLDDLLSLDHRARQVWDYVEGLDLSRLYAPGSDDGVVERPSCDRSGDPGVVMALRDAGRGGQRADVGPSVPVGCGLSVAARRGDGELPHLVGLPDRGGSGAEQASVEFDGGADLLGCGAGRHAGGRRHEASGGGEPGHVPPQRAAGDAGAGGLRSARANGGGGPRRPRGGAAPDARPAACRRRRTGSGGWRRPDGRKPRSSASARSSGRSSGARRSPRTAIRRRAPRPSIRRRGS